MAKPVDSGPYADRPAPGNSGKIFLPNDGMCMYVDSGAAWGTWGPVYPGELPVNGDFSWINQGGASVEQTYGGIFLEAPAVAGYSLRVRKKATPSTPYTVTAMFLSNCYGGPSPTNGYGMVWRQSSDGKLIILNISQPTCAVISFSDPTTASGTLQAFGANPANPPRLWLRLTDDGVNRTYHWSNNGQYFMQVYSHVRTGYITPDEIGFFVNASHATYAPGTTLLSWEET